MLDVILYALAGVGAVCGMILGSLSFLAVTFARDWSRRSREYDEQEAKVRKQLSERQTQ